MAAPATGPTALRAWAAKLQPTDQVALEATTNCDAVAMLVEPLVAKVVVSDPRKTRAIVEAKVKPGKVDARILAQLLAADFLLGTWVADDRTRTQRRLVMRRTHLVRQRTGVTGQVHAILARSISTTTNKPPSTATSPLEAIDDAVIARR